MNMNWSEVNTLSENDDPEKAYNLFLKIYSSIFDEKFPLTICKSSYKSIPRNAWISKGLIKCCNKKLHLYKKYIKSRSNEAKQKYIVYRNKLKTILKKAEKDYYHNKFTTLQGNIRSTWKLINSMICDKNKSSIVENFIKDDKQISDSVEIANYFNDYFTSVGSNLASKIPNSTSHYSSFLSGSYKHSFSLYLTNAMEVINIVKGFASKSSAGYDSIPVNIMKSSIVSIANPLANIINSSFRNGLCPDQLKIAKICPIFKDGRSDLFTNYRPISVLPSFSKIFEKIVYLRLECYLKLNNVLNENQFGFRSNHSSYMALLDLYDRVSKAVDKNEFVIGIFIDLSKAFDTIDHSILLKKLEHYGIRGLALDWFQSYLRNRKQFVHYNGFSSSISGVTCGVPQGSILGPLLFIIYVNDIMNSCKLLHFILFADDTNLIYSNSNFDMLINNVNQELCNLTNWFQSNRLSLNVKKTHYILFGSKHVPLNVNNNIYLNNNVIEKVSCTKFLGITVDEHLNWHNHISNLTSQLSRSIGILNRVRYILPRQTLLTLYFTLVHPRLLYGIIAWGNVSPTALNNVICLQKKAIRTITWSPYLSHSSPIFKRLGVLKLLDQFKLQIALFMFKLLHNLLPVCCLYFQSSLRSKTEINTRTNSQMFIFHQPRCRTISRERSRK